MHDPADGGLVRGRDAIDEFAPAGQPAIEQEPAERAEVRVGVIGAGGGIDRAVGLDRVREVVPGDPLRKSERLGVACRLEEPDEGLQHATVGIARIEVVHDLLAADPAGVEFLHVPGSIIAELGPDAFDHRPAHRGRPVALPPPRERVERQEPLTQGMQVPQRPLAGRPLRVRCRTGVEAYMIRIVEEPAHVLHHGRLDRRGDLEADRLLEPEDGVPPAPDVVGRPPPLHFGPEVRPDLGVKVREVVPLGIEHREQVPAGEAERPVEAQGNGKGIRDSALRNARSLPIDASRRRSDSTEESGRGAGHRPEAGSPVEPRVDRVFIHGIASFLIDLQ